MRIFQACYDLAIRWSKHPHATRYLGALSFAESMFFPIPPDVMLAPMSLSQPTRAWRFALLTTIASVLGGIGGYLLGFFTFEALIQPYVMSVGYESKLTTVMEWFELYGVWIVFLAGFSPIPYKVFTISAGVLQMAILPFILASVIGRGARFFLVAALMRWGGAPMEAKLRQYVEVLGWAVVIIAIAAYIILR
ncbi:DedA family protein [Alteromonas pelagimontana]|uniref:DedA family protein n=1 Tax=Alteromonas pelagimontana TaxID=1858656 RepID=A0A6M4MB79_9ALTE|nr:YqaA family protein [Alteromonas pelagimontana]QJR80413.1 DedA family protein [Alteromonas pelagimontana]